MDSESYLVKIIRSGSDNTADSLYLQTTIGNHIRWPIVLLVSTVVVVAVAIAGLIWAQVKRPVRTESVIRQSRQDSDDECSQVVVASQPSSKSHRIRHASRNSSLRQSFSTYQQPLSPERHCRRRSEFGGVSEGRSHVSLKRKVSWASTNTVKVIPKTRRHSEAAPRSSDYPSPSQSYPNRNSISGPSSLMANLVHDDTTTAEVSSRKKRSKSSELHLQISKTIAALDDLNNSLDVEKSGHLHTSTPIVDNQRKISKKKKFRSQKILKPLTRNLENLLKDTRSQVFGFRKAEERSTVKDKDDLQKLSSDLDIHSYFGQNETSC